MEDECPDETKDQFLVAVDDVVAGDPHQLDLVTFQAVQGCLSVEFPVYSHLTPFSFLGRDIWYNMHNVITTAS